jgi:hypothetical protein
LKAKSVTEVDVGRDLATTAAEETKSAYVRMEHTRHGTDPVPALLLLPSLGLHVQRTKIKVEYVAGDVIGPGILS